MDEHTVRRILEGGGGFPGSLLRAALLLPGLAYGQVMRLRRLAYQKGVLASRRADIPVIAVGNLTAGGTGKTPFTIMLAAMLGTLGVTPGILLRGYRRTATGQSDEETLYRRLCPAAIVEAGSDRFAAARRAAAQGAQAILLDDGFQHLRLKRDLDIVLIDATSPWGGGVPIPGGLLREPRSTLAKADIAVVTRSDQRPVDSIARLRREIERLAPNTLILAARHRPARLRRPGSQADIPLADLKGRKVVALCGIARPEAFVQTLRDLGADIAGAVCVGDHAELGPGEVGKALAMAQAVSGAVVTTEKDMARQNFPDLADKDIVWVLGVEQEVDNPKALRDAVERILGA